MIIRRVRILVHNLVEQNFVDVEVQVIFLPLAL